MSKYPKAEKWISVYFKSLNQAWKDPAFAEALVTNAREALQSSFGYQVPAHLQLQFVRPGATGPSPSATSPTVFDDEGASPSVTVQVPLPAPPPGLVDIELNAKVQESQLRNPSNVECWCCCC
jgi:ribosomally synthesized peptide (two-chain TOMM family)